MGRKSKAKKDRREAEQKNLTEKNKEKKIGILTKFKKKKSTKKNASKKISKKLPKIKITKKQILGGLFALIMLTVLISVGYLLFQKAFKPRPIAQILPADKTIAIVEINSNFNHNQLTKAFALLEGHEEYSAKNLIKYIEEKFLVNYETEIEPWLGRVVGFAIIKSEEEEEEKVDIVYFAEIFSETNAKEFIKKNSSDGLEKALIDEYMVLAENEEVIEELKDSSGEKLYDSQSYRRIDDNMPLNKAAFFFINFNKIDADFFQAFPELGEKGLSEEILQPVLGLLDSEGLSLVAMDDKFAIQTFISLQKDALEDSEYVSFKEKYDASLSEYVLSDAIAFWGGQNIEYQIKRMLFAIAGGENSVIQIFDEIVQNYVQKYFGPEVNFQTDLLPLLANEFALAMEKEGDENVYKLIIRLTDPASEAVKIHEIADNFAEIGAVFEPKIVEHTLEDGTVSKELVAVAEAISKEETTYKQATIYELQMGEENWNISYSIIDDVAIISTNTQGIKNAIDAKNKEKESLKMSETYEKLIAPVLTHSDEVSYFDMEILLPTMFDEQIPPFLELISSLSSGKSYFDDGITSINYLRIK